MYISQKMQRVIISSVIAGGLIFVPTIAPTMSTFDGCLSRSLMSVAHAEIKTYIGKDTAMFDFYEDDETIVNTVKLCAKTRAIQNATEQAGVYLQSYSKSINGNLTAEKISAITNDIVEVVDVQYKKLPYEAYNASRQSYGKVGIMYEATVTVTIETDKIKKYLNLSSTNTAILISQNNEYQQAINSNINEFENLRKRSETATTDAEREIIKSEMLNVEQNILYNQIIAEADKIYHNGWFDHRNNYNDAQADFKSSIELYNKAVQLKPNDVSVYLKRGRAYKEFGVFYRNFSDDNNAMSNYDKALKDFAKALELDPNNPEVYYERATLYHYYLKNFSEAIADYDRAIKIGYPDGEIMPNWYVYIFINRDLAVEHRAPGA